MTPHSRPTTLPSQPPAANFLNSTPIYTSLPLLFHLPTTPASRLHYFLAVTDGQSMSLLLNTQPLFDITCALPRETPAVPGDSCPVLQSRSDVRNSGFLEVSRSC